VFRPSVMADAKELKEGFSLFDSDGDGLISTKDIGKVMRALGQNLTEDDLSKLVKRVEAKGGSQIDFPKFLSLMEEKKKETKDSEDDIKKAFEVFDTEKTGKISVGEFRHVITNLGEKMTDAEADELIADANPSGDQIDYHSFIKKNYCVSNLIVLFLVILL